MVSNFVETTDWVKIAHKLRRHNRDLVKTVVHLEQALAESQERLQSQIQQMFGVNTKTPQRSAVEGSDCAPASKSPEDLTFAQEQVVCLIKEIEASYQAIQRQQIVIETLSNQLEASQERVAQMERECALLKEDNNEQTHKLVVTQEQVLELQARLDRQQRHTLQYKAALESLPAAQTATEKRSQVSFSCLPAKTQFIRPWSAPKSAPKSEAARVDPKINCQSSGSGNAASESTASPSYLVPSAKKRKLKAVELPKFLHC